MRTISINAKPIYFVKSSFSLLDKSVYSFFIAFSLISAIACIVFPNEVFSSLLLLPLATFVILLVSPSLFHGLRNHLIRDAILFFYFVRNSVTPFFMALGNYSSLNVVFESIDVLKSVILLSFEYLCVTFFMIFLENRSLKKYPNITNSSTLYLKGTKLFKIVVLLISLTMIACLIVVPDIKNSFKNMWTTNSQELITTFSNIQDYSAGTISRLLYAFFCFFFTPMLIIWLGMLITFIRKVVGDNIIGALLSLVAALISTFFVSETSLLTIFTILVLGVYITLIFKKKRRFVLTLGCSAFFIVLFLMVSIRANTSVYGSDSNFFGTIAKTLNAYVPGVYNVSSMWGLSVPSKGISLYWDLYSGIPLRSLIPPLFSGQRLSDYFNSYIGSSIQILPLIGQTYFYLSFFGPIVQMLLVLLALHFENKMNKTTNCFKYIGYFSSGIIIGSAILIYDLTIIVTFLTRIVLPIILITSLNREKREV